ncbi:MAG: Rrf2 family transcriptional regulator [Treponemataceae bacterium]|nr:Rrf2 family transcriptional regulator [Treponemataceae bacterium]
MKLPTRTQYGIRILCQLGMEYQRKALQLSEISEREGISEKYLGQIMLLLRASGLVLSLRGSQGGYYLSRAPQNIRLREVVEVLEGKLLDYEIEEVRISSRKSPAYFQGASEELCRQVEQAICAVLEKYTLDDMIRLGLQKVGIVDFSI